MARGLERTMKVPCLFADDMTLDVKNPTGPTKRTSELTHEFSRVLRSKVNKKKKKMHPYTLTMDNLLKIEMEDNSLQ